LNWKADDKWRKDWKKKQTCLPQAYHSTEIGWRKWLLQQTNKKEEFLLVKQIWRKTVGMMLGRKTARKKMKKREREMWRRMMTEKEMRMKGMTRRKAICETS
jgi:hypothetical protein